MKKILLLSLSILFAGEMEVDGNLKVTGQIDASNQRVKNVGIPQELTDAINGDVLQDALRDDGPFEYKLVATKLTQEMLQTNGNFTLSYKNYGESSWTSNFEDYLNTLTLSGWNIHKIIPYTYYSAYQISINYYILKRRIDE